MPAADSSRSTHSAAVKGAGGARDHSGRYLRPPLEAGAVPDHEILGDDEVRELCRVVQAAYHDSTASAAPTSKNRCAGDGLKGAGSAHLAGPTSDDVPVSSPADVLGVIGMIEDQRAVEALWRLVGHNLRLVRWVGHNFKVPEHGRLEYGDLYSIALIALIRCVLRYDLKQPFAAYAISCMRAEIKDALRRNSSTAHIPKNAYAGLTSADPELVVNAKKATLTLDIYGGCSPAHEDYPLGDKLCESHRQADENADTEEEALAALEEDSVGQAYSMIGEHERELLALHLGLPDSPLAENGELRVRDLMRHTGLSRDAVNHRLERAIRELRACMEDVGAAAVPVIAGAGIGEAPAVSRRDRAERLLADPGVGRIAAEALSAATTGRTDGVPDSPAAGGPIPFCLRCGEGKGYYNRRCELCATCLNAYHIVYGNTQAEWGRIDGAIQRLRQQPNPGDLRSVKEAAAGKLPLYSLNLLTVSKQMIESSALVRYYPYIGECLAGLDEDQRVYLGSERLLATAWPGPARGLSRSLKNLSAAGSINVLKRPHGIGVNAPPDVYLVNETYEPPEMENTELGVGSPEANTTCTSADAAAPEIAATEPSPITASNGHTRKKEMH